MAATSELSIWIKLKDDASAAIGGIRGKLDDMQPAFQKMAAVGTGALAGLGAMAYKAIGDFQGAELAQKQLEHAVLAVSKGTKEQVEELNNLTAALEKKGVVDADNLKVGVAQLSTFGLSTKMVKDLTPALADLAVNQFGVNVSGEQMGQTANMIAKALNGQFGVLEKSGIRFTEAQQKMIQYGTETQRAAALSEGFAQNLKLTNETARETSAGGMQALQVQIGNISENIGAALVPILAQLMEKIAPVIDKIVQWTEENPKLVLVIGAVAAGIAALITVLGIIGMVLPMIITGATMLGTAFTFMLGPIGLVILAIGALVAAGIYLYRHWDEVRAKAVEIWNSFKEYIRQTFDGISIFWHEWMESIAAFFREGWDGIKIITQETWQSIKDFFSGIWDGITNIFSNAISAIMDKIRPLLDAIDRVKQGVSSVGGFVGNTWNAMGDKLGFRALGGPVVAGSPYIVGENGPELFVPTGSGRVLANGYGGGTQINLTLTGNTWIGERDLAKKVGKELMDYLKLNIRV